MSEEQTQQSKKERAHVLIEQEANNGMNINLWQVERREERELARVSLSLLRMDKASYKEIGSALRQLAKSLGAGRGVIHLHKQADQVTAIIFDMDR